MTERNVVIIVEITYGLFSDLPFEWHWLGWEKTNNVRAYITKCGQNTGKFEEL